MVLRARIRPLDPTVVAQIAAGEVVERPFSVVKELVENAIDAGATRIRVDLEDGGRRLVRVADDGCGMGPEDLALAFQSHATSKLTALADLDAVASLGFRGEALASIGSVARARILSRPPDAESGHEVRCEGGRISEVRPAPAAAGTLVEVRDLFFNTPARRRFLRAARAERLRCVEVLTRLALAHPDLAFDWGDERRTVLPAAASLRARAEDLLGRDLAAAWIETEGARGRWRLAGCIAGPEAARRDRRHQYFFLNGRPIQDRRLTHALAEAFRDHLMPGRCPVAILHLHGPPDEVDVNVHPTKHEVRFKEPRLLYGLVLATVRAALGGGVARRRPAAAPYPGLPAEIEGLFGTGESLGRGFGRAPLGPRAEVRAGTASSVPAQPAGAEPGPDESLEVRTARRTLAAARRFLVVHDCYLILETGDGFAVVDQHALHERVLYEDLLTARAAGGVRVQRLLVPAVLDLPEADKEALLARQALLAEAGYLIEDFGGRSLKVTGLPACLPRPDPGRLVRDLVGELACLPERPAPEAVLERLHSAACRAAVKAGDRLSEAEIEALLRRGASCRHPHNCPHGRPTVLNFDRAQLERWFRRRV